MNGQIIHTTDGPFQIKDGNNTIAWSGYPDTSTHYIFTRKVPKRLRTCGPLSDIYGGFLTQEQIDGLCIVDYVDMDIGFTQKLLDLGYIKPYKILPIN